MKEHCTCRLSDGATIGFALYGDANGVPLLFNHGWPGSRLQGRILHEPALQLGVKVIAPERPGIGLSSPRSPFSLTSWAYCVRGLTSALGLKRSYLLGVSGGSPYTLASAAKDPERFISAGICCGAPPLGDDPERQRRLHWMYRFLIHIDQRAPVLSVPLMNLTRAAILGLPESIWMRALSACMPRPDRQALRHAQNRRIMAFSVQEAYRNGSSPLVQDGRRILSSWGFPVESIPLAVHFWHGLRDRNIPRESIRALVGRIPKSVEHVCDEDGHYSLPLMRTREILHSLLTSGE
ncbi:MAG: alpha/beta fold hydrolase [Desulfobacterales bacterium]